MARKKTSPKQSEASRKNGSNGKGPKSPDGKRKMRLNALKGGLFTKEIVVESAGERAEDFERLKKDVWDSFRPATALEEMLVADFIENRWRMQRVRRAESLELENRFRLSNFRQALANIGAPEQGSSKLALLKATFLARFEKYQILSRSPDSLDALKTREELEELRSKLASTSEGMQFLIDQLTSLKERVQSVGYIELPRANLILACYGFREPYAVKCLGLNLISLREFQNAPPPPKPTPESPEREKERTVAERDFILANMSQDWIDPVLSFELLRIANERIEELDAASSKEKQEAEKANAADAKVRNSDGTARATDNKETGKAGQAGQPKQTSGYIPDLDGCKTMLVASIDILIVQLRLRQQVLEKLQEIQKEVSAALAILPEGSDRFSRAESTFERRMYRALAMLYTIRAAENRTAQLPQLPK